MLVWTLKTKITPKTIPIHFKFENFYLKEGRMKNGWPNNKMNECKKTLTKKDIVYVVPMNYQ